MLEAHIYVRIIYVNVYVRILYHVILFNFPHSSDPKSLINTCCLLSFNFFPLY